MEANIPRI